MVRADISNPERRIVGRLMTTMDHYKWILGLCVTIILSLIAVIYSTLVGKINDLVHSTNKQMNDMINATEKRIAELSRSTDRGLDLKVNESNYQIAHQYERELFEGMKISIKELSSENSTEHKAIMIEIMKRPTVKQGA